MTVEDPVASTDLQNPADALEFLASVAERDGNGNGKNGGRERLPSMQIGPAGAFGRSLLNPTSPTIVGAVGSGRGDGATGAGVGGRADSQSRHPGDHRSASTAAGAAGDESAARPHATIDFPPLQSGKLSLDMIQVLLYR
jgi:hypothetical protein